MTTVSTGDDFNGNGICEPQFEGAPFESVPVTAAAAATANANYEINCPSDVTVQYPGFNLNTAADPDATTRSVYFSAVVAHGSAGPLQSSCYGRQATALGALVIDTTGGQGEQIIPAPTTGTLNIALYTITFNDAQVDLNEDGRFSVDDLDELNALIPTTDPDLVDRLDFNADGVVDMADAVYLNVALSCGLSAGTFGDDTGNGVVDCDDLNGVLAHTFGSTVLMGTPGYRLVFDADLDGDNDESDRAKALRAIQPADLVPDGALNLDDVQAFADAFLAGDLLADMDGNGVLNLDDTQAFADAFLGGCP